MRTTLTAAAAALALVACLVSEPPREPTVSIVNESGESIVVFRRHAPHNNVEIQRLTELADGDTLTTQPDPGRECMDGTFIVRTLAGQDIAMRQLCLGLDWTITPRMLPSN